MKVIATGTTRTSVGTAASKALPMIQQIEALRTKQIKNLFTINLLAFGVPMLVMGDEVRRSQAGNNNAYCQDNQTSWLDWGLLETHADLHRFVKQLIAYRLGLPQRSDPRLSLAEVISRSRVRWHGAKLDRPDWGNDSRSVAFTIETLERWHHLIFNAYWEPLEFELPEVPTTSSRGTGLSTRTPNRQTILAMASRSATTRSIWCSRDQRSF